MKQVTEYIHVLRAWLERNQVFFTVVAALLLGVMAIIVSIQANRLAEWQSKLQEQQMLPLITVTVRLVDEVESKSIFGNKVVYTIEHVEISNYGGPARYINIQPLTFLSVYTPPDIVIVPLEGYYSSPSLTGDAIDLLATLRGDYSALYDAMFRLWEEYQTDKTFYPPDFTQVIRVEYMNIFDEIQTEFYLPGVMNISNPPHNYPWEAGKLWQKAGVFFFDECEKKVQANLKCNISEITADKIADILEKLQESEEFEK